MMKDWLIYLSNIKLSFKNYPRTVQLSGLKSGYKTIYLLILLVCVSCSRSQESLQAWAFGIVLLLSILSFPFKSGFLPLVIITKTQSLITIFKFWICGLRLFQTLLVTILTLQSLPFIVLTWHKILYLRVIYL